MEEALSATLFDRGRDGIAPTKAAEDLMPVAEEIEQVMLRFTNAAEGLEREVSGVVRLTCPPDVAAVIVAPLIRELIEKHPAIRVELHPAETILDLTRREADVALRTVRPTHGDLVITRLTTARWVVGASPQLARDLGTLRAWTSAPWVSWGEHFAHVGPAQWFAKYLKGVEPVVRSDSLMVQLAVISTGAAIGLVPEPSLEHYGLVPIRVHTTLRAEKGEWPVDELFLVTHRALRDVPRVRAVWDLLLARHGDR
jgi:DNA-binding transcriptional LysR family regulator